MNLKEQVKFREKLDRLDIRLDGVKAALEALAQRVTSLDSKKTLTLKKEWQKSSQTTNSP